MGAHRCLPHALSPASALLPPPRSLALLIHEPLGRAQPKLSVSRGCWSETERVVVVQIPLSQSWNCMVFNIRQTWVQISALPFTG